MRLLLAVFVGSALVAPQVAWAWLPRDDSRMRIIRDNLCYETECGDLERVKKLVQEIAEDLPNVDLGDLNTNDWYILTDWSTGIYQVTDFGPGFSEDTQRRLCQSALDFMRGIRSISSYHDIDGIAFGACVVPDGAIDKQWYYEREAQIKLEALRIVEASGFGDAWEMKLRAGSRLCERDGLDCGLGARLMAEALLTPDAVRALTTTTVEFKFGGALKYALTAGETTAATLLRAASYAQCKHSPTCGETRLDRERQWAAKHPNQWPYPLSPDELINGEWVEWGREQYGLDYSGEQHANEIDHAGQADGSDGGSEATEQEEARAGESGEETAEAPTESSAQAPTSERGAQGVVVALNRWRWLVFAVVFAVLGAAVIALLRRRRRSSDVGPDV